MKAIHVTKSACWKQQRHSDLVRCHNLSSYIYERWVFWLLDSVVHSRRKQEIILWRPSQIQYVWSVPAIDTKRLWCKHRGSHTAAAGRSVLRDAGWLSLRWTWFCRSRRVQWRFSRADALVVIAKVLWLLKQNNEYWNCLFRSQQKRLKTSRERRRKRARQQTETSHNLLSDVYFERV